MMLLTTENLLEGDCVRLVNFGETNADYRRRLFAFGLTHGAMARVVRRAPLGCPIQLQVGDTDFMLRAHEASQLVWERI